MTPDDYSTVIVWYLLGAVSFPKQVNIHTTKIASMERWSLLSPQYQDQIHVVDLCSSRDLGPTDRRTKPSGNSAKTNAGGQREFWVWEGVTQIQQDMECCLESNLVEEVLWPQLSTLWQRRTFRAVSPRVQWGEEPDLFLCSGKNPLVSAGASLSSLVPVLYRHRCTRVQRRPPRYQGRSTGHVSSFWAGWICSAWRRQRGTFLLPATACWEGVRRMSCTLCRAVKWNHNEI